MSSYNVKVNLEFSISKIAAIALIILSPIFLEPTMIFSGWLLAGGLLGWKQGADAVKALKSKNNVE